MADDKICPHCGKGKNARYPMCKTCSDAGVTGASHIDNKPAESKPAEPKKEEKTSLSFLEIREIGGEGKYTLHIQVLNNNREGYKCKLVISDKGKFGRKIIPMENGTDFVHERDFNVGRDGFLTVPLRSFTDKRKYILVEVKGSELDETVRLLGPAAKPKRIEPNGGFWKNFRKK